MRGDKYARIALGTAIAAGFFFAWLIRPEQMPWWGMALAVLFGSYLGFSTVVGGFLRSMLPFIDRRRPPATADGIAPVEHRPESTMVQGRIEVGAVTPERRKSGQARKVK